MRKKRKAKKVKKKARVVVMARRLPIQRDEAPSVLKAEYEREANRNLGAGDLRHQAWRDGD